MSGIGRLDHKTQTGRHSAAARGRELYPTPACAIEALLVAEKLPHQIWEPAAGRGAIVNALHARGHTVVASDLISYGDLKLDFVGDFLKATCAPADCAAIVTNPPFKRAEDFVAHALKLAPLVLMLLRLSFLELQHRTEILENGRFARVHVFRKRLPMLHRDGWTGPRASNAIPFAWFVFARDHQGPTLIDRI